VSTLVDLAVLDPRSARAIPRFVGAQTLEAALGQTVRLNPTSL